MEKTYNFQIGDKLFNIERKVNLYIKFINEDKTQIRLQHRNELFNWQLIDQMITNIKEGFFIYTSIQINIDNIPII